MHIVNFFTEEKKIEKYYKTKKGKRERDASRVRE